tara:strand:- start:406 stop:765 length:360 start_codon:yes stop_codon:yes gene_type:complete
MTPDFKNYAEAQSWIAAGAAKCGGKNKFLASDEYRAAYPAIRAAYDADKADKGARSIAWIKGQGFAHGDAVKVKVGEHLIFGPIMRSATLDLSGAEPVARLDEAFQRRRNIKFPKIIAA